LNLLLLI